MRIYLMLLLIVINGLIFGQANKKIYTPVDLDKQPEFPNGQAALFKYLSQNIKYPIASKENGDCGKMIIQFTIEKNGKVTFDSCKFLHCDLACIEMKKVVEKMPKWTAGTIKGKRVRV